MTQENVGNGIENKNSDNPEKIFRLPESVIKRVETLKNFEKPRLEKFGEKYRNAIQMMTHAAIGAKIIKMDIGGHFA